MSMFIALYFRTFNAEQEELIMIMLTIVILFSTASVTALMVDGILMATSSINEDSWSSVAERLISVGTGDSIRI